MSDINQVILEGRLADEPEIRRTSTGKSVASITVACTVVSGDKEFTSFNRCVVWGYDADSCADLGKGDLVSVRGRLHHSNYVDREGVKKYKTEVSVITIGLVRRKGSSRPSTQEDQEPSPKPPPPRKVTFPYTDNKNGIVWSSPDDDGNSFATINGKQLCVTWTAPKDPAEGGPLYELHQGQWEPMGEVPADAHIPF